MENLGIRLKELRENEGLNQRDFAKKIGISQGMLSAIENGLGKFSERTQKLVCFEFGVGREWLLSGQSSMYDAAKPSPAQNKELSLDEQELLEIYDKLIPETQQDILNYAYEKLELQEFRDKQDAIQPSKPDKKGGVEAG